MKKLYTLFLFVLITSGAYAQICVGEAGQLTWESYFGIYDDVVGQTTALHEFPHNPSVTKTIYKLQSPVNYGNNLGSRIRGYLYVPSTTTVTFNVTGDDQTFFFLSTDENPTNKELICYVENWSSISEHDKYVSQTSQEITLQANVNYYFEVLHAEGTGGDHTSVYWKTDLEDPAVWTLITAEYVKNVACTEEPCPVVGTPCDDGNPSTINDVEDGFCHCTGTTSTSNSCVGERGILEAYRFEGIPGGDINDLYEAPNYPGNPDYGYLLDQFSRPYSNELQEFGEQVQAFISVPVSGLYKFNVTGDDNTIMFLSSDDNPENKQSHMAIVSNATGMVAHDEYIWQSTSFLNLEAGQYYYIELNFKHGTGGEHYSIFWQTPFTEEGVWKRIPKIHFYDYACEVACIAEGTPCDDGNPFTNDDAYDDNCSCVGIPCEVPDCDSPLANYVPYEKCNTTDQLDNRPENNWLSCEVSDNPNPNNTPSHWIMYDLGKRYELHQTQVWNYNVLNETDKGFQSVIVDVSEDGLNWNQYGEYNWPEAPGESGYSGFNGPDFQGTYARYILVTCRDASPACKGIGKMAFTAVLCPLEGTECDDNDMYTLEDKYDENCECKGQNIYENECEDEILSLGDSTIYTNVFSAETYVDAISTIAENNVVSFIGGSSVTLNPGFETETNALFIAAIDSCEVETSGLNSIESRAEQIKKKQEQKKIDESIPLQVISEKGSQDVVIKFSINKPGKVKLSIKDVNDKTIFSILDNELRNVGLFQKNINTRKFEAGTFNVELISEDGISHEVLYVQ